MSKGSKTPLTKTVTLTVHVNKSITNRDVADIKSDLSALHVTNEKVQLNNVICSLVTRIKTDVLELWVSDCVRVGATVFDRLLRNVRTSRCIIDYRGKKYNYVWTLGDIFCNGLFTYKETSPEDVALSQKWVQ